MSRPGAHPCGLMNARCVQHLRQQPSCPNCAAVVVSLSRNTLDSYKPSPLVRCEVGAYGAGTGHKEITKDAEQCVQQAVMYCATGKLVYADTAAKILTAWAGTCKEFSGSNAPLELGWAGCSFVRAAEILKHTWPKGWTKDHAAAVDTLIDAIVLPAITKKLGWTNNWQTTICEARLQIAIYRDNQTDIDWAIQEYKRILSTYVLPTGQTQETLRDLVHAQFGIGGLLQIPELLYEYTGGKVDLFTLNDAVMHKVCEFHAQLLLGKLPPNSGISKAEVKEPWFLPTGWEIALYHYERRLKKPMPHTTELLKRKRPESYVFHWGLGTLTHFCAACH